MTWREWTAERNERIRAEGRWRSIKDLDGNRGTERTLPDGSPVVSFASNDYLGLTSHPAVVAAAHEALDLWGVGAGSARLIVGSRPIHSQLERDIAQWKQTEAAVLFPTGFAANLGVLTAFGGSGATIFSDELNHASVVDGCRLAHAEVRVYPHADTGVLDSMLAGSSRPIVVSDTVFSMDGDEAPLDELAQVAARHGALLILDEAHAVLGPHLARPGSEVLRVGTLSKFLGAAGGFVAGEQALIDYLINASRPYIFTTASPPASAAAARAALHVLTSSEGDALLDTLRDNIEALRPGAPSPILPIVLGEEGRALEVSRRLLERGYLVPAIRPPSVPHGTSRLRVTVSAAHTRAQIAGLSEALTAVAGMGSRA